MKTIKITVRYYHNGVHCVSEYPADLPAHRTFQEVLDFLGGFTLLDASAAGPTDKYIEVTYTFVQKTKFDILLERVVGNLCEYTLDEFVEAVQEHIPVNDFELPGRSTKEDFLYILRTIRNWPYDD